MPRQLIISKEGKKADDEIGRRSLDQRREQRVRNFRGAERSTSFPVAFSQRLPGDAGAKSAPD